MPGMSYWTNHRFAPPFGRVWRFSPAWDPDGMTPVSEIPTSRLWCVDFESRDDDLHGRNGEAAFFAARNVAAAHMEAARRHTKGRTRMFYFGMPWVQKGEDPEKVAKHIRYLLMGADAVGLLCYDDMLPEPEQLIRVSRHRRCLDLAKVQRPVVAIVSHEYQRVSDEMTGPIPHDRMIVQVRAALTCRPRMVWAWSSVGWRVWQACHSVGQDHPAWPHVTKAREYLGSRYGAFPKQWTEGRVNRVVMPKIEAWLKEFRRLAIEVSREQA